MRILMLALLTFAGTAIATAFSAGTASADILAMMNYESKPAEDLKSLKLSGAVARREGIAIVDVDPESESFGKWLADITPKVGALGDAWSNCREQLPGAGTG